MSATNPVGPPKRDVTPEKTVPEKKESPTDRKTKKAYGAVAKSTNSVSEKKLTGDVHKTQEGSDSSIRKILRRVFYTGPDSSSPRSPTPSEEDSSGTEDVPLDFPHRLQGPPVPSREGRRPLVPPRPPRSTPPRDPSAEPFEKGPPLPPRNPPALRPLPTPPEKKE